MDLFGRKNEPPTTTPEPPPSLSAKDLADAASMMDRWDQSLGDNDAIWSCLAAIAQLGGFRGVEATLMEVMNGNDAGALANRPWRWWTEVSRTALAGGDNVLPGRVFLFAYLFTTQFVPTMHAATQADLGLGKPDDRTYQDIAGQAIQAMSNLPPSMMIHNSRTGMVDVASALDLARSVAEVPMSDTNQVDVPSARAPVDSVSAADLRTLFRRDASTSDRGRALQAFGATVAVRLRDVKAVAATGADVVAERSGQLLSEVVDHMPVRRAEELRSQFGTDLDLLAGRVIDDGVTLARWLWTASKAIPGPDLAVHAAKVVLHSAIEIRVVGELHEAHRDPDVNAEATPLSEILAAWVGGVPGGPTWSATTVVGVLITHTRRALNELRGNDGRIVGIMNRGREGGDIVRAVGEKMNDALRQRAIP